MSHCWWRHRNIRRATRTCACFDYRWSACRDERGQTVWPTCINNAEEVSVCLCVWEREAEREKATIPAGSILQHRWMDESNLMSDEKVAGVNGPRAHPLCNEGFIRFREIMTKYDVYALMELCFASYLFIYLFKTGWRKTGKNWSTRMLWKSGGKKNQTDLLNKSKTPLPSATEGVKAHCGFKELRKRLNELYVCTWLKVRMKADRLHIDIQSWQRV